MPGTVGTLFGWLTFTWIDPHLADASWRWLIAASFVLGCWACSRAGRALGVADHGSIVWDEVVAIWLVLWVCKEQFDTPALQLVCVVVFRFFDMVKPPPIKWFDTRFKNGFGVMLDDIVAALMTLLALAIYVRYGV